MISLKNPFVDRSSIKHFGTSYIPRILFQTWKTAEFLKSEIEELLLLRENLEDTQFVFHDDDDMFEYMSHSWGRHPIFKVFMSLQDGASRADVWRYCILYEHGGIYLDIDSTFDISVLDLISPQARMLISTEANPITTEHKHLCSTISKINEFCSFDPSDLCIRLQWLMFTAPRHPVFSTAIDIIVNRYELYKDVPFACGHTAVINYTGPALFTEAVLITKYFNSPITEIPLDFGGLAKFKSRTASSTFYKNGVNTSYHQRREFSICRSFSAINLGCGSDVRIGFENIDAAPLHTLVTAHDIRKLELRNEYYDFVYLRDVLEHMAYPTACRVLNACIDSVKIGGKIVIQTTSIEVLASNLASYRMNLASINYYLFAGVSWKNGKGSWDSAEVTDYDWHKSIFSLQELILILQRKNFDIEYANSQRSGGLNVKVWARRNHQGNADLAR